MSDLIMAFILTAIFILVWFGSLALLSEGGWNRLAKKYHPPLIKYSKIKTYRFQSIHFGHNTRYFNCLRITVFNKGIEIKAGFIIRFMHRPLFIPWNDIVNARFSGKRNNRLAFDVMDFEIKMFGRIVRFLYDKGFIEEYSENNGS